uniref:Neogenin-like protein n=1 Tax=Panagrellus redivivus TaxID=6233 RepID=A0A7E4V648_PANRE
MASYNRAPLRVFGFCLLLHLLLCQHSDAERIAHKHRRAFGDDRFLDFTFKSEPRDAVARPGGSATFDCQFDFARKDRCDVRIEWRKDSVSVSAVRAVGRVLIVGNGSLLIESVLPSDAGAYQCAVHVTPRIEPRTTWTFVSSKALLRVPDAAEPIFVREPTSMTIAPGDVAAFECVLNAPSSLASVEWYKDDRRIYAGEDYTILPITNTLQIASVDKQKHSGLYKCIVRDAGSIRHSHEVPLKITVPPRTDVSFGFLLTPQPLIATEADNSVLIQCLATSSKATKYMWLKDALPLSHSDPRVRQVGIHGSSLLIEKVSTSDAGVYSCRASIATEAIEGKSHLTVKAPPKILKAPVSQATQETADIDFDCIVAPSSLPTEISWFKNGEKIVPSEYFVIQNGKLRVLGLVRDDQGVYQCLAVNEVGSVQAAAQLVVDPAATSLALTAESAPSTPSVPSEPLGIKVTNLTPRMVSLKWDPPISPNGPIIRYQVYIREEESTRDRTVSSTTTSATVNDLKPAAVYVVRISAENRNGLGKSTGEFKITTAPEQPIPSRVRNLRATVLSPTSIEVSWEAPTSNADDTLRYKLYYIRKDRQSVEEETQVHMVKTSYTLHDLDKNAEYAIRVEAESANGSGPSSDVIITKTLTDVPSKAPEDVRAEALENGAIRVSWRPLAAVDQNGQITSYRIKYKAKQRGSPVSIADVEGSSREYTLNGLNPGTQYTVRVAAINTNGTGPFTNWVNVDTLLDDLEDTVISAPRSLRVNADHDAIHIAWEPPVSDDVIVRGYEVGWGPGVPDLEKARVDASARTYTITNLKPSREYVVSLRGYNNAGSGFPIYETVRTNAYGHSSGSRSENSGHGPSATPLGVRAETESSSSIRVSWTDPTDVFNPFYTARYSSKADNNGLQRFVNTSENEVVISDLRPNLLYEFAVKLVESPHWSMAVSNRTAPAPPSSAPRDLTITPPSKMKFVDPHTVTLHWQPPKYANGEVSDYSVLYTHRPEQDDKEWLVDSVRGDQLSMTILNLIPQTVYYFKIQARNVKGIGPFSSIVKYEPAGYDFGPSSKSSKTGSIEVLDKLFVLWETNKIYVILGVAAVCIVLLVILLTFICVYQCQRKSSTPRSGRSKSGYLPGRKQSTSGAQPDFWIVNGQGNARPMGEYETASGTMLHDLKRHDIAVDSPPPRYVGAPVSPLMSQSHPCANSLFVGGGGPPASSVSPNLRSPLRRLHRQSLPPMLVNSTRAVDCPMPPAMTSVIVAPPSSASGFGQDDNDSAIVGSSRASSATTGILPSGPIVMSAKRATLGLLSQRGGSSSAYASDADSKSCELVNAVQSRACPMSRILSAILYTVYSVRSSTILKSHACNGTMPRSYHQSSTSLEARQRTPQILYTGTNRQPIAKVDIASDHASSYSGSSTALQQLNNQTPPPTQDHGYRTIRSMNPSSNPLKSFAHLASVPPPLSPSHGGTPTTALIGPGGSERTAHIVRPIVVASPTNRSSPLNGPKSFGLGAKLPVGRATAQPRINVASSGYSPYGSICDEHDGGDSSSGVHPNQHPNNFNLDHRHDDFKNRSDLTSAGSEEEISMIHFDKFMTELQQIQNELSMDNDPPPPR